MAEKATFCSSRLFWAFLAFYTLKPQFILSCGHIRRLAEKVSFDAKVVEYNPTKKSPLIMMKSSSIY